MAPNNDRASTSNKLCLRHFGMEDETEKGDRFWNTNSVETTGYYSPVLEELTGNKLELVGPLVDGFLKEIGFSINAKLARCKMTDLMAPIYYKDVASRSVINARSALPWSCKRTILTQEVLRILLNCSRELRWEVVVAHFNHMMLRLQFSGYDQKFRKEVVRSALAAYNRLVELDANGEKPLYRPRGWKAHERARERKKRRDNWFRKGGYETVIFVPATPGSQIKRRYTREIKATEFKIKVVEQSATTLKAMLQKSDPFKQRRCTNADCLLCRTDGNGSCRSTGITFELVCRTCKSTYM
ncbi:hypothetical protein AWC38_SpisGene24230 [Stylophora pistillata]|uniref:Uncharacterized protein n=1 Tax=Stylophora pistillata TaxID=50429 RepID=A0A2B4R6A3_STYPI|nr:hypothetical protein AWC38_SpisGene24230 [Stylophora pistillata]